MSAPRALVTGASSGLGRCVAVELGRRRREVVLVARDKARLESAAQSVRAAGGIAHPLAADVTDDALGERVREACGGRALDLVVHAAGVLAVGEVDAITPDELRHLLEVNVVGTLRVVRATLPLLEAARGRVVLVSSVTGRIVLPGGFGAYAASKWAVRGFADTVRPELAARGVGLTVAYPSILDTPMVRVLGPDAPAVYRAFPWHDPEDAARRVLDDAARGRSESYTTRGDRVAAAVAGAFPHAFAAGVRAWVRLRDRGAAPGPTAPTPKDGTVA